MNNSISNLLIVLTLGVGFGCSDAPRQHRGGEQQETQPTLEVVAQSIPSYIVVDGRVAAKKSAEIATRMMARITDVPVNVGDAVKQGAVLIRLGAEDIEANRASAKAAVATASLAVSEARRQAARMDTLLAVDAVPQVQRDQAHLQLAAAESQLVLAESSLKNVETAASYSTIVAPFAGTVVSRFADPGDMAAPGRPLVVIQDNEKREGHVAIPASAKEHVSNGMTIEVSAKGFDPVMAAVTSISTGVDPMSGTVEIITALPATWTPGTTLTAQIPVGSRQGIAVPETLVVRRGQLTGVRVAGPEGASIRWVRLGRRITGPDGEEPNVEILSGLEAGERILL
ncbi:MAG: efflux RND transporter periplasmic adaptor subunit [Rhodothermales bacterium]